MKGFERFERFVQLDATPWETDPTHTAPHAKTNPPGRYRGACPQSRAQLPPLHDPLSRVLPAIAGRLLTSSPLCASKLRPLPLGDPSRVEAVVPKPRTFPGEIPIFEKAGKG